MTTTEEALDARNRLLTVLKPGDTVFTILRHVSQSGMLRVIDLMVIRPDGKQDPRYWVRNISYDAAVVLDYRQDRRYDGLRVSGYGMDMGFHLVYSLSAKLFGYAELPETGKSGAYALNQTWL